MDASGAPSHQIISVSPTTITTTSATQSDDPELSQLMELTSKVGEKRGMSVHIMGDGAVILVPKAKITKVEAISSSTTTAEEAEVLLEGPQALQYFMNADNSDCLIIIGSYHIHAQKGR